MCIKKTMVLWSKSKMSKSVLRHQYYPIFFYIDVLSIDSVSKCMSVNILACVNYVIESFHSSKSIFPFYISYESGYCTF